MGRFCGASRKWNTDLDYVESETYYDSTGNRTRMVTYNSSGTRNQCWWYSPGGLWDSSYVYREDGTVHYMMKDTATSVYTRGRAFFQDFRYPSGHSQYRGYIYDSRRSGTWMYFDSTGKPERQMNYEAGKLTGTFTAFYPNGKIKLQTYCYGGYADTMHVYTSAGKRVPPGDPQFQKTLAEIRNSQQDIIFHNPLDGPMNAKVMTYYVEAAPAPENPENGVQPAYFPGRTDSLDAWVKRNAHYPDYEMRFGSSGVAWITFDVETDGSLSGIYVSGGDNACMQKEALRVVRLMPRWKPAIQDGKAVKRSQTITIYFKAK